MSPKRLCPIRLPLCSPPLLRLLLHRADQQSVHHDTLCHCSVPSFSTLISTLSPKNSSKGRFWWRAEAVTSTQRGGWRAHNDDLGTGIIFMSTNNTPSRILINRIVYSQLTSGGSPSTPCCLLLFGTHKSAMLAMRLALPYSGPLWR